MFYRSAVLAACLIASTPAHASRSCLDRAEAARTWPTRALAVDGDGCFTYMRRGLKPAPIEAPAEVVAPEVVAGLDMSQRWPAEAWPTMVRVAAPPRIEPQEPLMTPLNVTMAIGGVAAFCAWFKVLFGGVLARKWSKNARNRQYF